MISIPSNRLILWENDCTIVPLCLPFQQTIMQGYNYICVFNFFPPTNIFIAYIDESLKNGTMTT